MKELALGFIPDFAWALDYIFKTIQYGRPFVQQFALMLEVWGCPYLLCYVHLT